MDSDDVPGLGAGAAPHAISGGSGRTAHVAELGDGDLDAFVAAHPLAAVYCWRDELCLPHLRSSRAFGELALRHGGRAAFGRLDLAENPGAAERLGIGLRPAVLAFRDGALAGAVDCARPRGEDAQSPGYDFGPCLACEPVPAAEMEALVLRVLGLASGPQRPASGSGPSEGASE